MMILVVGLAPDLDKVVHGLVGVVIIHNLDPENAKYRLLATHTLTFTYINKQPESTVAGF